MCLFKFISVILLLCQVMILNSLQQNIGAWSNIGANHQILEWITQGVPIPFSQIPAQYYRSNGIISVADKRFINEQILCLTRSGVLQRCEREDLVCVSPLKCIAKKGGKKRLLVNLHELNQYINSPKFRYESLDSVADQIRSDDILHSIDLKDGFFHVPVHPTYRKYLGISWNNKYYYWCTLPQGLSCSPYYFYKVLRPVVQYLRENLLRVNLWVDDFLLMSEKRFACDHKDLLLNTLEELGWIVNYEKSDLSDSTDCTYVGFEIESNGPGGIPWLQVTKKRVTKLKKDIHRCLSKESITSCVAGQCVSMTKAVLPAKLLLQNIYKYIAQRQAWDELTFLPSSVTQELKWWESAIDNWNGSPFRLRPIDCQLVTDASGTGWGACLGQLEASGIWTKWIGHMPSNYRELLAVGQALKSFGPLIRGQCVQVLSDNVTTVACINHLYSPSSVLGRLAQAVWVESQKWNVVLRAKYLAGKDNIHADALSRIQSQYEWCLHPRIFQKLEKRWGPHSIDRCASMMTAHLPVYNSLYYDPLSSGVDCLAQRNWASHNNYVNPPFWLIPKMLSTLVTQKATATIIAPWWPAQPWCQEMLKLAIDLPVIVPNNPKAVQRVLARPEPWKNRHWKLFAWRVSGQRG